LTISTRGRPPRRTRRRRPCFSTGTRPGPFLYRHLVAGLADECRCVAPDYLGSGLSARSGKFDCCPSSHARAGADFVDELDLCDVVPVAPDRAGPLGFPYALDHPRNVRGFVVTDTTMWPVEDETTLRWFSRLAGGPVGRRFCERADPFGRVVMPVLFGDRSRFLAAVYSHYFPPDARLETWDVFPRALGGESGWPHRLWSRRDRVADHPARLVWGMADLGFGPEYHRTFEALFSDASVTRRRGVGHNALGKHWPDLVSHVRPFLDGLD
jgi:haloalkane dehalogenase